MLGAIKDSAYITSQHDVLRLFEAKKDIEAELARRGWLALRELGYTWFRETSMKISYLMRGKVVIVMIEAVAEHNHAPLEMKHEIPLTMFNTMLQRDFPSQEVG